jgi:murein L,D-transpeptidase YafK
MRSSEKNILSIALLGLVTVGVLVASSKVMRSEKRSEVAGSESQTGNETLTVPLKEPRIVVYKSKRQLELYSDGKVVRSYRIGLGFSPVEDKQREGDGRTPEGDFYVFVKNPKSAYHLSLGVSYPNLEDAERGLRDRLISKSQYNAIVRANNRKAAPPQYTPLGGLIYIHGNGATSDWTWGCVALENENIKELYDAVAVGTPVTIKP